MKYLSFLTFLTTLNSTAQDTTVLTLSDASLINDRYSGVE